MKRYRKSLIALLLCAALLAALSAAVSAAEKPIVLSASFAGSALTVSGTAGDGVLALVVLVYDAQGRQTAMDSCAVNGGRYSHTLPQRFAAGVYTVKAADYRGGDYAETTAVLYASSGGGSSSCTLTFVANGGGAVAAVNRSCGAVVELSAYVPARDGFAFGGWYADAALTSPVKQVTLDRNTTVYAGWTPVNPFTDVPEGAFCRDAAIWAARKGVASGTTATTFSPADVCTRAQAVTFLWRAMGSPEPSDAVNPFADVAGGAYFYKAVLWAVKKGVAEGATATTFEPDGAVTRAEAAVLLWRAAGSPEAPAANPFSDVPGNAYFADAVRWAAAGGVTGGTSPTAFSPAAPCTRAQFVTFLYRRFGK